MPQQNKLTREEAIAQIASQLDEPIGLDEFVARVLSIWPSQAKDAQAGVRQQVRNYHQGKTVIFLDDDTVVPMQIALSGVRLRVELAWEEVKRGRLEIYPAFDFLLPRERSFEEIQLVDEMDQTIPTEIDTQQREAKSLLGAYTYDVHTLDLGRWYKKRKVKNGYSLVITVVDWEASKFRLQPESRRERGRYQEEIEASNQQLADILFALLEASRHEMVSGRVAIPTAYARLKDSAPQAADHWLIVIDNDPRMRWTGHEIMYADALTPMEQMIPQLRPQQPSDSSAELSPEQAEQVYRFKAYFKHRKGLWRRIDIQGGQTLADFDAIVRAAFQHDFMDHLSGFWQLVRRGDSRRFREIDLGSIHPFGGGDGADKKIAALNLEPGHKLKYVYDFGDWVEHEIELKEIVDPEAEAEYPRIIDQNKPRYKYCPTCREEGRKTIATHICINCSNAQGEEVVMCEDCIYPDHDDHYLVEIVY